MPVYMDYYIRQQTIPWSKQASIIRTTLLSDVHYAHNGIFKGLSVKRNTSLKIPLKILEYLRSEWVIFTY